MSSNASHDDEQLDFGKLEKEVQMAVIHDERYWRENDAKIRAVEQRVPTYDDFREMVKAAHLKPLEKDDKISSMGAFTQVWNQAAQKKSPAHIVDKHKGNEGSKKVEMKLPSSGQEFLQHWRQYCKTLDDKKQFLFTIGSDRIAEIFKTEISGGLLGEFLECLLTVDQTDAQETVQLLESFTKTQRFGLSLVFFSKKEKESCKLLFDKLKSITTTSDEMSPLTVKITEIQNIYEANTK